MKLVVDVATLLLAVIVTMFVPTGKSNGDVMILVPSCVVTVGAGMPDAEAAKVTFCVHWSAGEFVTISAGGVITGGWPMVIVTSANEALHGELVMVQRAMTGPAPLTWVNVAFGVMASGL